MSASQEVVTGSHDRQLEQIRGQFDGDWEELGGAERVLPVGQLCGIIGCR